MTEPIDEEYFEQLRQRAKDRQDQDLFDLCQEVIRQRGELHRLGHQTIAHKDEEIEALKLAARMAFDRAANLRDYLHEVLSLTFTEISVIQNKREGWSEVAADMCRVRQHVHGE